MITRRHILAGTGSIAAIMTTRAAAAGESTITRQERNQTMQITRAGSQPSNKGPADYFTGTVRVDPLFPVREPGRVSAGSVTFEPGARTAWHTHPLGQILIITAGMGWVQYEGGPIEEVRPGDVVWFPPDLKHWHGATPTTAMTHTAIQETLKARTSIGWKRSATSNTENRSIADETVSKLRGSAADHDCVRAHIWTKLTERRSK
jgi:quercetin dioxygenase-like cupin family protein